MAHFEQTYPEVYNICHQFHVTEEQMVEVVSRMTKEIGMGLAKDTHPRATVKCFVTYVQDLPTGRERGKYLALDLGGTNFRILLVKLNSETDVNIDSATFAVDKALMVGKGQDLFGFIADCLAKFCKDRKIETENLPLGFTFSFPCKQLGIDNGTLVSWTKGFNASGVVGQNVVDLLREAVNRRNDLKVKVVAILNDTTGTLMSCAFTRPSCRIGMIVGTGSNACYVEKTSNVEMFNGHNTSAKPNMIINAEWGAFGDNGVLDFVRTRFDRVVDKSSINPKKQIFEKCISGMYMGELVRLMITELMESGAMFKGKSSTAIQTPGGFDTRYITEVELDPPGSYNNAAMVMDMMGIRGSSTPDLICLRYICETVVRRSAKLAACGLVCLIKKMNIKNLVVGIDGSVYRYHPHYHRLLTENMNLLLKGSTQFELTLSEDGSGRGAALIAAVCAK